MVQHVLWVLAINEDHYFARFKNQPSVEYVYIFYNSGDEPLPCIE